MSSAPILDNKDPDASSVFEPAALLGEYSLRKIASQFWCDVCSWHKADMPSCTAHVRYWE